jgi:hypothetical protein
MKKEQIILIRLLSVAAVMAVAALILIFGLGVGQFQNIVRDINHNVIDFSSSDASIYNLYYYKGMDCIYQILFSVAIFTSIAAVVGIITRYQGAYIFAKTGACSMIATGAYVIIARIFEHNSPLHRFIAKLYLGDVSSNVSTAQLMNRYPVWPILLIIFSILALLLLRSSGMKKLEIYHGKSYNTSLQLIVLVLYITIFFQWIRPVVMNGLYEKCGNDAVTVGTYMNDYYFADAWMLDLSYVWYIVIAFVMLVIGRERLSYRIKQLIALKLPVALLVIRSLIYYFNPPRLFGYLTFDENICDLTEKVMVLHMLTIITDVFLVMLLFYFIVYKKIHLKKILIICGVNAVISILVMWLAAIIPLSKSGITGIYIGCILSNLLTIAGSFYMAYIGARHH